VNGECKTEDGITAGLNKPINIQEACVLLNEIQSYEGYENDALFGAETQQTDIAG
jgi:hypothetical protein